jgi:hypothetical protein
MMRKKPAYYLVFKALHFSPPLAMVSDIYKVINFVENAKKEENFTGLVVHCWRGMARSTAIALGILFMDLEDEEKAIEKLFKIRPYSEPLNRIIELWDQVLKCNIKEPLDNCRNEHIAKINDDIYEDMLEKLSEEERDSLISEMEEKLKKI